MREKEHKHTKNGRKWLSWDTVVLAYFRPGFLFASFTLSQAQQRYSQLDSEALAITVLSR